MGFCHGLTVWVPVALMLADMLVGAIPPQDEENPVKFGFDSSLPPQDKFYVPHEASQRPHQLFSVCLSALVVCIASAARTGGGALLNAVYVLILSLEPDEAIPVTSITVFGGAICDVFFNLWKKSIHSNFSLINWDFILLMQPMLLTGAALGASMTVLLSSWLLVISMIVYLIYVGRKIFVKAYAAGHDEGWRCCSNNEMTLLLGVPSSGVQDEDGNFQYRACHPWRKVAMNLGLFVATLLLTLLRGGKYISNPFGIPPGSFVLIFVSALPVIFLLVVSRYQMKGIVATFQRQQSSRYILAPNEVKWSPDFIQNFSLHLVGSGFIAGAFGVGNEDATSILLRRVNFPPEAVSAMSATTVFFVSGVASLNFLLWGHLDLQLAKLYMPLGLLMTLLGRMCLGKIAQKAKSCSLLLFAIAAAIFISIVPLSYMELRALISF